MYAGLQGGLLFYQFAVNNYNIKRTAGNGSLYIRRMSIRRLSGLPPPPTAEVNLRERICTATGSTTIDRWKEGQGFGPGVSVIKILCGWSITTTQCGD